jgi:hypothetical protein
MHILGVKPFMRFLESKKLNAFRVEAQMLQPQSRAARLQALRQESKR